MRTTDTGEIRYALEDLRPGMTVRESQLKDIKEHYILLGNVKRVPNTIYDVEGIILFMGCELTPYSTKLSMENPPYTAVYNIAGEEFIDFEE